MTRRTLFGLFLAATIIPLKKVYAQAMLTPTKRLRKLTFGMISTTLFKSIDLTPDQQREIALLRKAFAEVHRYHRMAMSELRKEIADELFDPTTTDRSTTVRDKIAFMADRQEDFWTQGYTVGLEVKKVLRPDQLRKIRAVRQDLLDLNREAK